jgi:5'/3'-nucleotidase
MNILLTNDDGIQAPGLLALYRELSARHMVTVVAPDRERSAVGHGITLHQPLRAQPMPMGNGGGGFAVNGTPADCVKLALLELLSARPDMVISGINPGANVGVNINYSGTVAAAKEAALYGLPAIAASVAGRGRDHFDDAAVFVCRLMETTAEKGLPFGTILNVNIPDLPLDRAAGVKISKQGIELFEETIEKRTDPRNRPYFWQGCDAQTFAENPDADGAALGNQYVTITPIKCDTTDYAVLEDLKGWDIDL